MFSFRHILSIECVMLFRRVNTKYCKGYHSSLYSDDYLGDREMKYIPVADFYAGKSVFITGGTGFLGKVFIEKLLYSCTELDKIYMLIREKQGMDIYERIEKIFQNPLFTRLRANKPNNLKKLVPIAGDISLPGLGIKPEEEKTLIDEVSVVFHSAATVRFDEPLPVAMNINYEGTQKMMNLCKRMKNVEAFVYISTAYAHTDRHVLEETVYPPPLQVDQVYKFMEKYGHDREKTKVLIDRRPNTYTFSKALTEVYIADNHGDMPTVILRPSIVTPIKDEPLKGWLDNWFGATGVLNNIGQGWNHINLGDCKALADLIPVDYVANMSIVAAARLNGSKVIQVLNSCTSSENPITWKEAHDGIIKETVRLGKNEAPCPFHVFTKSRTVLKIVTSIFQMTPAYLMDLLLRIRGKEAKYVAIMSRVISLRDFYDYFSSQSWVMKAARSRALTASLSPADKKLFPFDPTYIRWDEYMRNYCQGIYRYLKSSNSNKL